MQTVQTPPAHTVRTTPVRTVLALDLSKTSTGWAVLVQTADGAVQVEDVGTIVPAMQANRTKWYAAVIDSIRGKLLRRIATRPWFTDRRFTLAIESNTFGQSYSEFQFYLGQELLRWGAAQPVDTVTYSPNMIKAFAKQWSRRPDLPSRLEKDDMWEIYSAELCPRAPDVFPSLTKATDDAVDAMWLGLLALYAQAHILPTAPIENPWEHPFWAGQTDPYRTTFLAQGLNTLTNLPAPDLKKARTDLRANKHLSLAAPSFYPFAQLRAFAHCVRAQLEANQVATVEHCRKLFGKGLDLATLLNGRDQLDCLLDRNGGFMLVA